MAKTKGEARTNYKEKTAVKVEENSWVKVEEEAARAKAEEQARARVEQEARVRAEQANFLKIRNFVLKVDPNLLLSRDPGLLLSLVCFDIFSPPPGDSDVISQVERLSFLPGTFVCCWRASRRVTIPRQSRGLYFCEPLKAAGRGR